MKKALLVSLSFMLVAAMAVGMTVAYLQDTDSAVNVMTLGNVHIEQIEQERDANGNLVPFTQAKPLYPATGEIAWNDNQITINGHDYNMFGDKLKNAVDKIVTVKNTGISDAYVRTVIAIEDPFDVGRLGVNVGGVGYKQSPWYTVNIDGVQYSMTVFTYEKALAAGEESLPSLLQVYLKSVATNEDVEKLGASFEILVKSQAIQTAGFADAEEALNAGFGEITATNHPWSNTIVVDANNETEILDALTNGKDVIVNTDIVNIDDTSFNGKGATVTLAGSGAVATDKNFGYLAFAPGKGNDTSVENLNVTGTGFVEVGHYKEGNGTYTVNNLKITDLVATLCTENGGNYIAAAFAHYGTATLTDCIMKGTVALKDGYTAYDASFVNGTKTTIDGGEYGKIYLANQAHVAINDAEIDTIDTYAISAKKLGKLTIGSGTTVGTINVSTPGSYKPALVIEDGATVGTITYKGVSYTAAEWNAAFPLTY